VGRRIQPKAWLHFAFQTEIKAGGGEDAEPILGLDAKASRSVISVFDGLGGAGSQRYEAYDGHTGAYLASRLARQQVQEAIAAGEVLDSDSVRDIANHLAQRLHSSFANAAARLESGEPSVLRSRMIRVLPTTLALAAVWPIANAWHVGAVWAGDSRVYALTPGKGLQQLTQDHQRHEKDAFDSLYEDPPLANVVSASTPFYLEGATYRFQAPFVIIVASDGCFGYLRSPMAFEELLLETLNEAHDAASWQQRIQARILESTADDCSLACVAPGTARASDLAAALKERLNSVRRLLAASVTEDSPAPANSDTRDDLRRCWEIYRLDYYAAVPEESCKTAAEERAEEQPVGSLADEAHASQSGLSNSSANSPNAHEAEGSDLPARPTEPSVDETEQR
jgi:hypothetical protein